MSIFDNIKSLPKSKEIDLLIKLKYGEPNHTDEYFERLPEVVISCAYRKLLPNMRSPGQERQVISIYLRQPINKEKALEALHDSLVEYHLLLG